MLTLLSMIMIKFKGIHPLPAMITGNCCAHVNLLKLIEALGVRHRIDMAQPGQIKQFTLSRTCQSTELRRDECVRGRILGSEKVKLPLLKNEVPDNYTCKDQYSTFGTIKKLS